MRDKKIFRLLNREKKGQAVLTVVLVMVVALTIGLSIASQTVTDVNLGLLTQETQRAFSAAEAGLEMALSSGESGSGSLTGASYNVKINEAKGSYFLYPVPLTNNEIGQIWLVKGEEPYSEDPYTANTIRIVWGNQNTNWESDENTPAIEIILLYQEGDLFKIGKYALDPRTDRNNNFCLSNGNNCDGISNFTTSGEEIGDYRLQFGANLDLSNFTGGTKKLILARIKLFYNLEPHYFGVKTAGGATLPLQGKIIESVGTSGRTVRKINLYELFPGPPLFFDFSVFSGKNLEK